MTGRARVLSRRIALFCAIAVFGGVVVGIGGSSPVASATPSWGMGVSVIASGFTFINPIDVALSPDEEYLFVLDNGNRVVKVDIDADTASVLTSAGNIDRGKRITVNGDNDAIVSEDSIWGSNPDLVLVDGTSGTQSIFKTGLNVAGPVVWDENTGQLLTAERRYTAHIDWQDYLISIDSGGTITDLDRPRNGVDFLAVFMDDIMLGPDGSISAVFNGQWSFGGYYYQPVTFDYSGDATTTGGTWAQTTNLWRMGRTTKSAATGMMLTTGLASGAYDTFGVAGHILTAYPQGVRTGVGYFGDRAYVGSDGYPRLPLGAQPTRIAGSYSSSSSTGQPGGLSSPSGMAVLGSDPEGADMRVFIADWGNNRVVVVRPPKLQINPLLRQGRLASNGIAEDPVTTSTGNFSDTFVDLPATAGLFGMDVERSYNSTDGYGSGAMGPGWTGPYAASLRKESVDDWRVIMPDGRNVIFESDGSGGWIQPLEFNGELTGSPPTGLTFPNGESWSFNASGYLTGMTSWDGQSVSITRSGSGEITALSSSAGATLTFTYASGKLTEVDASDGRSVQYGYNGTTGLLETVTGADGQVTDITTDANAQVTEITDPSGVSVVANTYDAIGRIATQTTPGGTATFVYDDETGDTTVTTSGVSETLTFSHDGQGRLAELEDPDSYSSTRTYDANGWIESGTSRINNTIATDFDARGNPTSVDDPASGVTSYTYDGSDRVLTSTSPTSGTTTYTYTGANRIPSTVTDQDSNVTTNTIVGGLITDSTDPDGVTTTFTYTALRQVETVTDELSNETAYTYDTAGRIEIVTTPDGRETAYTYDDAGRVLTVEAPDGGITETTYDDAGRVLTVEDPTGAITTNTYNSLGLLASTAKPGKPATTYTYTAQGELEEVVEPTGGGTITFTYGTLGRLESVEDQLGKITSYGYDADGRQTTVTAADTGVSETIYNTAGQVTSTDDPLDRTTTYTYFPNGLVESVETPAGGLTEYTYDTLGRVSTVTDPTGIVTTTTYTDAGRTETVVTPAGTTSYAYDDAGRLETVTNPASDGTDFVLSGDGLTESVTSPGGLVTSYTYDDAGRVATETDPAGVVTTRTWSDRGELLTEGRTGLGTASYTYNPDGTMATATDPRNKLTTFAYDDLGRLTTRTNPLSGVDEWTYNAGSQVTSHTPPQITGQGLHPTTYTYDDVGRLETLTDDSGRTLTNTYDVAGQLTGRSATDGVNTLGYTFGYDDDGRLISAIEPAGTATWAYDAAGRLTKAATATNRVTTYTYDSAGRIASRTNPDGTKLTNTYDNMSRVTAITPAQVMADTFTTSGTAPDGNKWTVQSNAGGATTISSNAAQMSVANSSGSTATLVSKGASLVDSDVSYTYSFADTTAGNSERLRTYSRYTNASNSYRLELTSNSTTARFYKDVAGTTTPIATFTIPSTAAGTRMGVRFQTQGTTLRAKVWDDTAGSEPGSWTGSTTDSSLSGTGVPRVQLARAAGANSATVDNLTYTDPTTGAGAIASYTYDDDSHVTGETLPGGSRTWTWTNGRVTGFSQTLPSANRSTTLGYNSSGLVSTDTTGGSTTTYGYDAAAQLTSVTPSVGSATTYTYDDLGRRTAKQLGAGTPTSYTYNEAAQLTLVTPPAGSATSMTYDDAGRRLTETTGANTVTSTYDPYGRLATLARGGTTQTRTYDSAGNVTGLAAGANSYSLDWDTNRSLPTLDGWQRNGNTTTLVEGPTGWADMRTASTDVALPTDVYGSVLSTTGTSAVAQATSYDEYGSTSATLTFDARLGYRGELTLDNLTNLRARNYQPGTGQFTTVDPLDDVAGTPTIGNPYHYTDNNPINSADPSGLRATDGAPGLNVREISPDDARLAAQRGPATGTNIPKYKIGGVGDFVAGLGTAAKNFFLDLGNAAKFVAGTVVDAGKCFLFASCDDIKSRAAGIFDGVVQSGKQVWHAIKSLTDGGNVLNVISEIGALFAKPEMLSCAARRSIANCSGQVLGGVAIGIASGAGGAALSQIKGRFGDLVRRFKRSTPSGTSIVRYDPDFAIGQVVRGGQARASDLVDFGASQGWRQTQTAGGPIKFVDGSGTVRLTIKSGSPRAPRSGAPHIEIRNAGGQRIDAYGNPVTRRSPGNHSPIIWDLGP